MYKLINGWTKETVMAQVKKYNNGTKAERSRVDGIGSYCSYRADNGNRCAIGCFIPYGHESLKAKSKTGSVEYILEIYPDLAKFMPLEGSGLGDLQLAHDQTGEKGNPANTIESIQKFLDTEVE